MIVIEIGTPQPVDCPNCKCKNGYRIIQLVQLYSFNCFDKDGNYFTEINSESRKVIRQLKKVCCHECLVILPFRVS
jgi:hypothetical protein